LVRILPDSGQLTKPRFAPVGDCAVAVEFGDTIDLDINRRVLALDRAIAISDLPGIVETVPTFRSLLVVYEPEEIEFRTLTRRLSLMVDTRAAPRADRERLWTIPIAYDFPGNTDFERIREITRLTRDEVIRHHTSAEYDVFLIGFIPGMPIMGGLPEPLRIPRRPEPLPGIPAGRVMIAGGQVEIVTMTMWTGWYCIGQTPLRPYDLHAVNPFLFRAGDRVRFRAIGAEDLDLLADAPASVFLNEDQAE
jgi:inhibitor of KinA